MTEIGKAEIPEHLENGGSQITKRKNCPGSRIRELEFPEESTSKYAEAGTRIHSYAEYIVDSEIKLTKKAYTRNGGEELEIKGLRSRVMTGARKMSAGSIPLDAEQSQLDFALDYSHYILDKLREHKCLLLESFQYALEKKVILDLDLQLGGTIDFLAAFTSAETNKNTLVLIDLKTGIRDAGMEQLILYACAAQKECGHVFEDIHCYIFQPLNEVSDNKYKHKQLTKDDVQGWEGSFLQIGEATFEEGARENVLAGEHCYFCNAKLKCEASQGLQHDTVAAVLVDHDEGLPLDPPNVGDIVTRIPNVPVEKLIAFKRYGKVIKKTLEEIDKYLEGLDDQGNPAKDIRVVQKNPRRSWKKDVPVKDIAKSLLDEYGIRGAIETKLKGLGEVEKLFKKKGIPIKEAKEMLGAYVVLSNPGNEVIYDPEGQDKRKDKNKVQLEMVNKLLDQVDSTE